MTAVVTETQDLISTLCRQFSEATGWWLQYAAQEADSSLEARLKDDPDCVWLFAIEDGISRLGYLHLSPPGFATGDAQMVSICALASSIGRLLSAGATAKRRLEMRTQEVSTLVDIGLSSRDEENLPDTLSRLLRGAAQLTGYRSAALFLLNPATNRLTLRAAHHVEIGSLPFRDRDLSESRPDREALAGRTVHLQNQVPADAAWLPRDIATAFCVAVQSQDVPIGTLWVYDRRARTPSSREAHALKSIAAQLATFLERVVLLRESESQQRLVSEVRTASENQIGSMLEELSTHPGFEAAARCVSRHELGGDLCELLRLSDRRTGIAIGDASGNSVPAALVMSAVRGALRTLPAGSPTDDSDPAQTMRRLNQALHDITCPHQFLSLFYGEFDAATRRLSYTNAGHPNPVLIRNGNPQVLESNGLLLGVLDDVTYGSAQLDVIPGDLLVLFTDGISESMSDSQELFRTEGIIAAACSNAQKSAQGILQSVWSKAEAHAGRSKDLDDRTLLVLGFHDK